jgi:small ligand-binding sensory domain FIST
MSFKFAAAVSQNPSLYKAIEEVVLSCKEGLQGRVPDFCQLLITKAHARNLANAPRVREACGPWQSVSPSQYACVS